MPGYKQKCESFKIFEKNNRRASVLIDAFTLARTAGRPKEDERALLQGAVVFAIGALDNYIHELILEVVTTFGGNGAALHEPFRALVKDDPAIALRVALAGSDADRRAELRSALERWLDSRSFHGVQAVIQGLSYCGVALVEDGLPANWKARVEHFTKMRHKIVHRGLQPSLVADDAKECVGLVGSVAANINAEAVLLYRGKR
ncbi:hypothetical protein AB0O99_04080 [Cellulosimicrobium funkei]|uniref:hypothetical protein n=1 Tax=Cellulosimicrobium funkei TaxID=264251 RepID=UPI0034401104